MADRVLPSNWGITIPEQLLGNLRVAETGGDIAECADALEWMLRSGRLVDREAIDLEAAIYEWFDGQSLFAAWSDTQVRGYAIALADALKDTDTIVAPAIGDTG